jgi:hypothetical protein
MTETQFWDFIDQARAKAGHDLDALQTQLNLQAATFSNDELVALDGWIWFFLRKSYLTRLWAAAYLINGGCSDDGFDYFRGWLVAQGKSVFFAALKNPDSLADWLPQIPDWQPNDELEFEDMLSVASGVYKSRTGDYPPSAPQEPSQPNEDDAEFGKQWQEDDEDFYVQNFPCLSALINSEEN